MKGRESILYVLPGKLGGVVTNLANLQAHVDRETFRQTTVLTYNELDRDALFRGRMGSEEQSAFTHALPLENLHSVLGRFRRTLPPGGGVLVASDWMELASVCRDGTERAVIQVLHGDFDFYYELAQRHETVVDAFVAVSGWIHEKLVARLPGRRDDIHHIPYGVPLPDGARRAAPGPLRLVYAGRLDRGQKRIFDLPAIDAKVRSLGASVSWTIVGDGPDGEPLRALWRDERVRFTGVLSNRETVELMREQDVLVLPSQAEGLPLSLLEAMGTGLVPVVSDLESGIREVVHEDATGFRVPVGEVEGFARAIAALAADRSRLERMSAAARTLVHEGYGIDRQAKRYEELYADWRGLRRPKNGGGELPYGSRLDRRWIPNRIVRFVRERRRPELKALLDG